MPWQREDGIGYRMVSPFHATSAFLRCTARANGLDMNIDYIQSFPSAADVKVARWLCFSLKPRNRHILSLILHPAEQKNDLSSAQTMCTSRYIEIVIYFDMCVCCSFPFNLWGDQRCQRSLGWSEVRIPVYPIIWLSPSSTEPSSTMYLHLPRDSPKVILNPGNNWIVWFHSFGDLL